MTKSKSSSHLIKLGLGSIILLIVIGLLSNLEAVIYDFIPLQLEVFIYKTLHYLAQAVTIVSPQASERIFFHDWLVGGLIIGWLVPTLLFIITCIFGYFTTIHYPRRAQKDLPVKFSLLQDRVSKSYWRAKFIDIEKTSFAVLAVGSALFLILLATRQYLIERFPFVDGAALLCFIGYSYIFNIHFLFFKDNSPRKILHLIDNRLQLKQGLLTLWDNRKFTQPSPLNIVLAKRVQERLKRFKPRLIFPHKMPRLNQYNFIAPIIIIGLLSLSTALALPQLQNSLQRYLDPQIITSRRPVPNVAKRPQLDNELLQQGEELKLLGQQLAKLTTSEINTDLAPSLVKLGNDLITLSKKNIRGNIIGAKNPRSRPETFNAGRGKSTLDDEGKEIMRALLKRQIDAAQSRLDPDAASLSETLTHSLDPMERFSSVTDNASNSPESPLKLRGKISNQLRKLAMEMLDLKLSQKTTPTHHSQITGKPRPGQDSNRQQAKAKDNQIKAISKEQGYKKTKDVMAKLSMSEKNISPTPSSTDAKNQTDKSEEKTQSTNQIGKKNKATTSEEISLTGNDTLGAKNTDSATTDKSENNLSAFDTRDEKQSTQKAGNTGNTDGFNNQSGQEGTSSNQGSQDNNSLQVKVATTSATEGTGGTGKTGDPNTQSGQGDKPNQKPQTNKSLQATTSSTAEGTGGTEKTGDPNTQSGQEGKPNQKPQTSKSLQATTSSTAEGTGGTEKTGDPNTQSGQGGTSNQMDSDFIAGNKHFAPQTAANETPVSSIRTTPSSIPKYAKASKDTVPLTALSKEINTLGENLLQLGKRTDEIKSTPRHLAFLSKQTALKHSAKSKLTSPQRKKAGGTVPAPKGSADKADAKNAKNLTKDARKQLPERVRPTDLEVAPTQLLQALPDEFFEWYMKKWQEEEKLPQPPSNVPLNKELQEKIQVTAKKLELLGGHMMITSNPRNIKLSPKHKANLAKMLRKHTSTNTAPGEKNPPGLSNTPNPTSDYEEQLKEATNELDNILTETEEWLDQTKPRPSTDTNLASQAMSGGTAARDKKAVVVRGQNPRNKINDMARVRLKSFPTHEPSHESLVNLSPEVGDQNGSQDNTQQRLAFQRQAKISGSSMKNLQNIDKGMPNIDQMITQQHQGLKQIKESIDNVKSPEEIRNISHQLATIAKWMEKKTLELEEAISPKDNSGNKLISSEKPTENYGSTNSQGQRLEMIPPREHEHFREARKRPDTTFIMPKQVHELKQVRRNDKVVKTDGGTIEVTKQPRNLTTGPAGLSSIASQFAKLRTTVMGTTQPGKLKQISQEMIELSGKLEQNSSNQMLLIGQGEGKRDHKISGKYTVQGAKNLKPSSKASSSKFIYPELRTVRGGQTLAKVDDRQATVLPKTVKDKIAQLKVLKKKLQKSKNPKDIQQVSKEILHFSQELYKLIPERANDQIIAVLKEGVKRQGKKIKQTSKKLAKTKDPKKIDAYALELSQHAANLKTLSKKSEAVGWKKAKGLRKYANQLKRTSQKISKRNQSKKLQPSDSNQQEMALQRNAYRIKELSHTIATSKDPKEVQKSAKELLKLSRSLSDISYNLGLGKGQKSFTPQARKIAQKAIRTGGNKLQKLLTRVKEQQGTLELNDLGMQLKSVASSLNRVNRAGLSKKETSNLKKISSDLLQIATQLKNKGTSSAPKKQTTPGKTTTKGQTGEIKNTPLNQVLPRLAQYADKLSNMKLGDTKGKGNRKTGDSFRKAGQQMNETTLSQVQLSLQKAASPDHLREIASQIKDLGKKLLDTPLEGDRPDPSQRPLHQKNQANFPKQINQTAQTTEENLLNLKKQAALQKLDNFIDKLTEQQQQMGTYSLRDVAKNISGNEEIISVMNKGVDGAARQSLFSKGEQPRGQGGRGSSGMPTSDNIDNVYPMKENLAGNQAFSSIVNRVKRYRNKLAATPTNNAPQTSLNRIISKTQRRTSSPAQPKLQTDLRWTTETGKAGQATNQPANNIGPKWKPKRRKAQAVSRAPQAAKIITKSSNQTAELPVMLEPIDQKKIPLKTRQPKTKIEQNQKLAAQQEVAAPINRAQMPQEYQNILKRIYLYFQDTSSQPEPR